MKQIIPIFIFFFLISTGISAQSFDEAMEFYQGDQYEEAAELFSQLTDDRASLFAGKSYLALSDYSTANNYLYQATESSIESIRYEAFYTLSLSHFELKNYDRSLQYLYRVAESTARYDLRRDSREFYTQILNYLSASERFDVLFRLDSPAIRFDLVNSSRIFLPSDVYDIMVSELLKMTFDQTEIDRIENELQATTELHTVFDPYPIAPEGTIYNIGVILPEFDENDPDFTIPRNLYFGMMLAADDFNSRNITQKVKLTFKNSYEHPDSTATALTELANVKKIDAVIGPLFSEPAARMASLSEDYKIPMLAPLANADDLNRDYNYVFQLNPTFETHGMAMAHYAVSELGLNNIAIIVEEGSLGRISAMAFRREAERMGANITYYIEKNFEATGFDFSEITEIFTPDTGLRDSLQIAPSQAIYAPFTGQASSTMMNLMLNDLEAMRSDVIILGSEEWEHHSLTDFQQRFFDIFYTQSFDDSTNSALSEYFIEDYESRFGSTPDRFSRIGYDAASFMFQALETAGNPHYLSRALRTAPVYHGLAAHIHFDGKRINQSLFIKPLTEKSKQRLSTTERN